MRSPLERCGCLRGFKSAASGEKPLTCQEYSDASWSQFFDWLQYFGLVFGKIVVAVPPQYTSTEWKSYQKSSI